jgi:hypothetical protein
VRVVRIVQALVWGAAIVGVIVRVTQQGWQWRRRGRLAGARPITQGAFQAGSAMVRARWREVLVVGHLGALWFVLMYVGVIGANLALFRYNFWTEPPPSTTADTFAVVSLGLVFLFGCLLLVGGYGWMCRLSMGPMDGSTPMQLAASVRTGLRSALVAAPLLGVILVGAPFVLPTILIVPWCGAAPFRRLTTIHDAATPRDGPGSVSLSIAHYWAFVFRNVPSLLGIALVTSLVALPIDGAFGLGDLFILHLGRWDTVPVVIVTWVASAGALLLTAWSAAAFGHVWATDPVSVLGAVAV